MARLSKKAAAEVAKKLAAAKNCPHPEDKRVTLGYGIYCDVCKTRVGIISEQDAMKAMMNYIKGRV